MIAKSLSHLSVAAREAINSTAAETTTGREQVLFTLQSRPLKYKISKTRRDRLAFEIGMALKPNALKALET